jgi:hypothetical protein
MMWQRPSPRIGELMQAGVQRILDAPGEVLEVASVLIPKLAGFEFGR